MKLKKSFLALILAASMLIGTACGTPSEVPDISDSLPSQSDNISNISEEETSESAQTSEATAEIKETEPEESSDSSETTPINESTDTTYEEEQTTAEMENEVTQAETVSETEAAAAEAVITTPTATTAATTAATTTTITTTDATTTAATTVVTTTEATTTTAATTVVTTTEATTTTAEETTVTEALPSNAAMRNMTTAQIVKEMGLGINLGNTMEACGDWINSSGGVRAYETAWGSPVITEEIIKGYSDCGFGVLRIPVAWSNLMGSNYTINSDYMARVKQIVDWTINSGMYAIVNIHYDSGWWENFPTQKDECMKKYTRIWEQISDAFKDYSDKLMFESLNEEGGWQSVWNRYSGGTAGKAESFGLLNEINQKFVDTVRASGGNNALRHLLIAGYNTDIELTCDSAFVMPKDSANRCAVSVHYYTPVTFCILEEDADWGKAKSTWGSSAEIKELQKYMDMVKRNFVDKGIPVIIGEYGAPTRNKEIESIRLFVSFVAKEAYARDMCPVLWDVTNHFYDRQKCGFIDNVLLEQIMAAKQ